MKKILMFLLLIVVIFVPKVCFAGDIPEWLLDGEGTQTFIGEVKEMTEESVTIIQRYNIKGEFEEGSERTYHIRSSFMTDDIKVGELILCGYADENNFYLYKIKKFENGRIELSDDYPMTKRLEDYINNGDFAKAELKRLSGKDVGKHPKQVELKEETSVKHPKQVEPKEETSVKHPDKTGIIGGADELTSNVIENTGMVDIWKCAAVIGILLVTTGVLLVKRQKRTR